MRTFTEAGIANFSFSAWYGIHVPGKTPQNVTERLRREIARIHSGMCNAVLDEFMRALNAHARRA